MKRLFLIVLDMTIEGDINEATHHAITQDLSDAIVDVAEKYNTLVGGGIRLEEVNND